MKWLLIGFVCVVCPVSLARGDAAGDLYNQGVSALSDEKYDVAAQAFNQIITGYPNTPNIDEVRLRLGFAYLHVGDFPNTITALAKLTLPTGKPEFRATALYFTALAQFSQGEKLTDKTQAGKSFSDAQLTLTTLINYIPSSTVPQDRDYLEDASYYRALSQYERADYDGAEKDLLQLLQQFSSSLKKPDYLLLLGSLYAVEANQAVDAKKTPAEITAIAQKSLDSYNQVSSDPNALVQANDANMSKAQVLFLLAQLDPKGDGYQKALDAFRLVRRKDDMIELQQERLDQLQKASKAALQQNAASGAGAAMADANSRLIDREAGRLKELQNGPNPITQALVRMAECYVAMKQPDEARTILHRLVAHGELTPDQQQEVDFQTLYSYVLGGQTDKADKALDDYLSKHAGDPQADSISYQIASKLMDRKDYNGALAQADRSLKDFPKGRYTAEVHSLKAQAYKDLGQLDQANAELKLAASAGGPLAIQNQLVSAQTLAAQGDLNGALDTYKKVKDNADAGDLQAYGEAGYISTLQALERYDEVISESKIFQQKYPTSKALPGVLLYAALAMDHKNDPGAVAALQDIAKEYPKADEASFALSAVVTIYQRAGNVAGMIQAANDLRTAFPNAYPLVLAAADSVSDVLIKQKKFDDALALYQPLLNATKPDVAAAAQNKTGTIWLASAKSMGAYQSLGLDKRPEAEKRLTSGEQAYLSTLKKSPDQLAAVGDAFDGLNNVLKQRRSWGLLTDATMEAYLAKITADLTSPDMLARVEMAKAGLVFVFKNGTAQYPAALDRFRKAVGANSSLALTRQETDQYGELLIAAKDYATASQIYTALLANATSDPLAQADGYYGIGAAYLAQGDVANAAANFKKMKALPGGAQWHPHIQDANFGLALAAEQAGDPTGLAKQTYASLMQLPDISLQAKAMLGYGRLLEKAGYGLTPADPKVGPIEFAVHYYQEPHTLFGAAVPTVSAEGLYDAGQVYAKAGDKANAKQQFDDLQTNYAQTAPDWAAKAKAAEAKL